MANVGKQATKTEERAYFEAINKNQPIPNGFVLKNGVLYHAASSSDSKKTDSDDTTK